MSQPKFKVGDFVRDSVHREIWQVHWINYGFNGYEYMSEIIDSVHGKTFKCANEAKLELYQEPKKKELYFWIKDGGTEIKIFGKADRCPEVAPVGYSYYGRIALNEMKFHETPAD